MKCKLRVNALGEGGRYEKVKSTCKLKRLYGSVPERKATHVCSLIQKDVHARSC
jgi:hypothetical protein